MLQHPDLITSAPVSYTGMRDPVPPHGRWKYSLAQVSMALGGTGYATWHSWESTRAGARTKPGCKPRQNTVMPQHYSAYMALLDDAHPRYTLTGFDASALRCRYGVAPPVPLAGTHAREREEVVAAFLHAHGIRDGELRTAFGYAPDGSIDKRHSASPRTIGANGVRWAMLQLMCDEHPTLTVVPR